MTERDDMEGPGTYEDRMLDYAERQTRALEALRTFAFVVLLAAAVGLLVLVIALLGSS